MVEHKYSTKKRMGGCKNRADWPSRELSVELKELNLHRRSELQR